MNPPVCRNCLCHRATQDHIASCNLLMNDEETDTAHRFKPEKMLTSSTPEQSNFSRLFYISKSIAKAVQGSLPDLDFDIISY